MLRAGAPSSEFPSGMAVARDSKAKVHIRHASYCPRLGNSVIKEVPPMKQLTHPSERGAFIMVVLAAFLLFLALFVVAGGRGGGSAPREPENASGVPASGPARPASGPVRTGTSAGQESLTANAPRPPQSSGGAPPPPTMQPSDFPTAVYAQLLDTYLEGNRVDYSGLSQSRGALDEIVRAIEITDRGSVQALGPKAYIAWWVNAYNILTLKTIVDHFPTTSIRDIDDPWDTRLLAAQQMLTLNDIEHNLLRLRGKPEADRRAFVDPRIHFGLNCASTGCPDLQSEPFTAANLDELLDAGVRSFIAEPTKFRFENDTLYLSELLKWYGEDFELLYTNETAEAAKALGKRGVQNEDAIAAVARFFADYVEDDALAETLRSGTFDLEWQDYDWSLNGK
ncbi:MAG: hypothetical protein PWP23_3191 [Candidatus Sumerlaeota bacterium]|nr:hypothetical protein [Candidatus Sumerlaeota bacterium]